MTYRLAGLPAGEATGRRDELIALCARAFCGAPWHEPPARAVRTVDRLLGSAAGRPGFLAVAAFGPDDGLRGFAAGWTDTALSGDEPAFELAELVVAPAHQGLGLGRALHDALLTALPPGPRRLMTLDVPELTERYARWGWAVAERRRPGTTDREYVVMHRNDGTDGAGGTGGAGRPDGTGRAGGADGADCIHGADGSDGTDRADLTAPAV
ncbi:MULTISPECIES: GNAT family N-acetyltransferase [unclassified Streptomyces]|uniref:GNAT family N-acetyltransferase n=1 Tax=unclassified Streptomyces TaxID=2593676 RepID=UPI00382398DE